MNKIKIEAQDKYDFYETNIKHSYYIYNDLNPKYKLNVLDICSGLGNLSKPFYENNHDVTMVEINEEFIPYLKSNFERANIIQDDFFKLDLDLTKYDIILSNPPFRIDGKHCYEKFFLFILNRIQFPTIFYFICPKMFYLNQMLIKLDVNISSNLDLLEFIKTNNHYPASYYYEKYKFIELHTNEFRFNNRMITEYIKDNIIDHDLIVKYDDQFVINKYCEIRYMLDIFDFEKTKCRCGLFKVCL